MNPARSTPRSSDRSIQADLWRRGVVGAWKFDSTQRDFVKELDDKLAQHQRVVLLCGRRMGKSFALVVKAIEHAIKNPGAQVKYISSTTSSVTEFVLPIFQVLVEDAPADITPTWLKNEAAFRFWNGSRIKIFGTDSKNFRKLRGQRSDLTIIDEAGFTSDLKTTVVSVLSPQALTTGGRMILASTAPDTPGHDFTQMIIDARADGSCVERTIYERLAKGSTRETPEQEAVENARRLAQAIKDCGGEDTSAFRREYMNDLGATDSTRAAVPRFTDSLVKGTPLRPGVVREVKTPKYCHKYSAGDLGYIDQSAFVTGYVAPGNPHGEDPPKELPWDECPPGAIVIMDELVALKLTSDEMKPLVLDMERTRWGAEPIHMRPVDGTPEQITQVHRSGLNVFKTRNDKPDVAIDEVQKLLVRGLLIIHPRCTRLIACMQAAVWKKDGVRLDRHPIHGHYDLLMALAYLVRNVQRYADPFPYGHNAGPKGPGFGGQVSSTVQALRAGFKSRLPFG